MDKIEFEMRDVRVKRQLVFIYEWEGATSTSLASITTSGHRMTGEKWNPASDSGTLHPIPLAMY
jgi:hypothetical protein